MLDLSYLTAQIGHSDTGVPLRNYSNDAVLLLELPFCLEVNRTLR